MIKYKIKSDRKLVLQKLFAEEELASGTAQEMKFSIRDFFSKCDQIRGSGLSVDLVTFTEEILNRKLYFLCSVA